LGIDRRTANQAVDPFPQEDELEAGERHAGRAGDFEILRSLAVEIESTHPIGVGQGRDGAGDRVPAGDRQAAFGQPRDPANDDHGKHQSDHDE